MFFKGNEDYQMLQFVQLVQCSAGVLCILCSIIEIRGLTDVQTRSIAFQLSLTGVHVTIGTANDLLMFIFHHGTDMFTIFFGIFLFTRWCFSCNHTFTGNRLTAIKTLTIQE